MQKKTMNWIGMALAVLFSNLTSAAPNRPATSPATKNATTKPESDSDERLNAELETAWKDVFPPAMREGKIDPSTLTDEQKFLAHQMQIMMITAEATPQRLEEAERNRAKQSKAIEELENSLKSVRTDLAGKPKEVIDETEQALQAEIEMAKAFGEMTNSPVTRGATQEQVELAAFKNLKDLPAIVRRVTILGTQAKHHAARANLLTDIAKLTAQSQKSTDAASRQHLDERIDALKDLLKAVDARAEAEQRLYKVTPLGWLNNIGDEK